MRAAKPTAPDGATVTNWRGYTRYECTKCAFDALDREKFEDHWQVAHGSWETHADERPAFDAVTVPAVVETRVED